MKWLVMDGICWERSETTPDEEGHICDRDGIAEHGSHKTIIDPETGDRWALCWVRMPSREAEEYTRTNDAMDTLSENMNPVGDMT